MKKGILALTLLFILIVFGACSFTKFDGNRTGNASELIMDYEVLNTTDSQMLELQEGDYVDFVIICESGKLDILFQKKGDEPMYRGTDIPTSSFEVEITESGSYKASVTGKNAKGSVSIIKRESN